MPRRTCVQPEDSKFSITVSSPQSTVGQRITIGIRCPYKYSGSERGLFTVSIPSMIGAWFAAAQENRWSQPFRLLTPDHQSLKWSARVVHTVRIGMSYDSACASGRGSVVLPVYRDRQRIIFVIHRINGQRDVETIPFDFVHKLIRGAVLAGGSTKSTGSLIKASPPRPSVT